MLLTVAEAWAFLLQSEFETSSSNEKETIAKWLLEVKFGVSETEIRLGSNQPKVDRNQLEKLLVRLLKNEPVQYLIGEVSFYNCSLKVASEVLIPRPETEELAFRIVEENRNQPMPVIWDICSGSGCLAISLAKNLKTKAFGFEISEPALNLSRENAELNSTDVEFFSKNVFDTDWDSFQKPSVIVSNPPYVMEKERAEMKENVLAFEPELALFVSNEDPLVFYRQIAHIAFQQLSAGGKLYFEINEKLGAETVEEVKVVGFSTVELWKDWSGKDRFVKALK